MLLLLLLLPLQNEVGTRETREGWGNCRRPRSTVVGEVRWQSINIQNQRRARETEGGRASERVNERTSDDRPKVRERQKHRERKREGEVEGRREKHLAACVRSFVLASPKPYGPKLGARTKKKRRDERATETSRSRRLRRMAAMDRKPGEKDEG